MENDKLDFPPELLIDTEASIEEVKAEVERFEKELVKEGFLDKDWKDTLDAEIKFTWSV